MIDHGNARKVLLYLQKNFPQTIERLQLKMEPSKHNDQIIVNEAHPFFMEFMLNRGYCNRHIYNEYKPSDVLAFVVMCHYGLFQPYNEMDIRVDIFDRYMVCAEIGERCRDENQAQTLYAVLEEYIKKQQPLIVDFFHVKEVTPAFIQEAIGKLYETYKREEIWFSLRIVNMTEEAKEILRLVSQEAYKYYNQPLYREIVNNFK